MSKQKYAADLFLVGRRDEKADNIWDCLNQIKRVTFVFSKTARLANMSSSLSYMFLSKQMFNLFKSD